MKIEIEIPDPPEGWVYDGFRNPLEREELCLEKGQWITARGLDALIECFVAIKAKPLWTPSPELVAVLRPGWIARDESGWISLHQKQPTCRANDWYSTALVESIGDSVKTEILPPTTIPWDKCCFRIGGDE
jgi:hypothetical protein